MSFKNFSTAIKPETNKKPDDTAKTDASAEGAAGQSKTEQSQVKPEDKP